MAVTTLRDKLTDATAKAQTVISAIQEQAEAEEREFTAEERAQIEAALDEARTLKARIARAEGDDELLAQMAEFNRQAEHRTTKAEASPARERKGPKSIGQQFVESAAYDFIRKGRHHGVQGWSTGAVELEATLLDSSVGSPGSGGDLIVPDYRPGIVPLLFRRLTIADLMPSGTTDSNVVTYMVETTFTNAAAAVAEGSPKPESTLIFDSRSDIVRKIAHWLPVTDEMLEDVSQIRSFIDARLRLGVQLTEEDQLLNGSGLAPNIQGILNRTGLQADQPQGSDTNADAIFKQMMNIYTNALVMPDAVVVNPANWQTIVLSKNQTLDYYAGGPFAMPPVPRLWGLPVVVTPAITVNTALVGAFGFGAQVFRKGGITVEASNSHSTFFVENKTAIRAEERLALAVYRPGAFGEVTGLD